MGFWQKFHSIGDGEQDDATLYSLANEFFEAACALQEATSLRVDVAIPIYYLLGHSAELTLKAFLYKHGFDIKELMKIRHDLEALIISARDNGMSEKVDVVQILELSLIYKNKNLEYRKRNGVKFPNILLLTNEIKSLQATVFNHLM